MNNHRPNPYPGPRSFRRGEKLYGREHEKWNLLDLLIAERIVLLYSPSGAGKTSLIQAALMPELEHEGFRVLPIMSMRMLPGVGKVAAGNPYILSLLLSLEEPLQPAERTPIETLAGLSLAQYLDLHPAPPGRLSQRDVLIFDQFEEVLTIQPTDVAGKQAFFEQIGQALANRNRWALFAIREEFIAGLDPYVLPIPTRFDNSHRFRLDLLSPEAAREAMQGPAKDGGVRFTDAAAEKVVNDLRLTRVQLPDGSTDTVQGNHVEAVQLQVVCRRLWERLQPGDELIDEQDVRDVGTVDTALRGYYAETVEQIAQATSLDERKIRAWVDHQLITEQGIRSQVLKGRERSPEGKEGLENAAVDMLVDSHLARAEQRRNTTWFELSHDRLIEPIRTDNAAWREAHLSLLQRQADQWQREGRPHHLLLQGQQLISAELWYAERPDRLEPYEREFLEASREAREQSLSPVERDAARWASEGRPENLLPQGQGLVDARRWSETYQGELKPHEREYLAAAEQHALVVERERRQGRRIRILAWVASILAICALVFAAFARSGQSQASDARATAEAEATRAFEAAEDARRNAALATRREAEAQAAREMASREARRAKANELAAETQNEMAKGLPDPSLALLLAQEAVRATWDQDRVIQDKAYRTMQSVITSAPPWQQNLPPDGPGGPIQSASFSPDGSQIATTGDDNTPTVWDVVSSQPTLSLQGHTGPVFSVAFSPDGQRIVSASKDGTAKVWDSQTGAVLLTLAGHGDSVTSASFSPDGSRIVTSSFDNTARIWDAASGRQLGALNGHQGPVITAHYSPDGNQIITASSDGTVRIWDAATGRELRVLQSDNRAPVGAAAWSPDGALVVSGGDDNLAHIWEVASGREIQTLRGHGGGILSVAFSPDGTHVVTASADATARVWDVATGNPVITLTGHTDAVNSVSFGPGRSQIVTASSDGTAKVWGARESLAPLLPEDDFVTAAGYSSDGNRIVTGQMTGGLDIWDALRASRLVQLAGHDGWVNSVVFAPGGQALLTVSIDGTAHLWDAQTGQELRRFAVPDILILWAAFSPDGKRIVTTGDDNTVRVWDAASGQELQTLQGHSDTVWSANFSPDGQSIVTASGDGTARLWDAANGQELRRLEGHTDSVRWASFSPDGSRVLTASADTTARTWDAATGAPLQVLAGHTDAVNTANYGPDGNTIVTASNDGTTRVWNADTGRAVLTLDENGAVWSAWFSKDGSRVLTVGVDGWVRQWPLTGDALIARAQALVQRYDPVLTQVEKEQYGIQQ